MLLVRETNGGEEERGGVRRGDGALEVDKSSERGERSRMRERKGEGGGPKPSDGAEGNSGQMVVAVEAKTSLLSRLGASSSHSRSLTVFSPLFPVLFLSY